MDDFVGRKDLIPPKKLKELYQRSNLKGGIQTLSHFGAIFLTGMGIYFSFGSWWLAPFFLAHGILLNYLFAAQHEYNHYSAFRTRWVNDVFNRITGFIQLYPRNYERWYHFEHHRHTQDWETDPELISRGGPYTLWSYLPYLVGVTYWSSRIQRLFQVALGDTPKYFTKHQVNKIILESRLHLLAYSCVAATSVYYDSWGAILYWIAPMFSTKIFQNVQNITEHTGLCHEPDTIHNTRTISTWPVFKWLAWNMQYHTAHHTFPAVPFFNLPELHKEMVKHEGYEPPTTSYLAFQIRFIRILMKGPETKDGIHEIDLPSDQSLATS